jgi:hypothetical protein
MIARAKMAGNARIAEAFRAELHLYTLLMFLCLEE